MHSCYMQISLTNLSFLTINCYTKVCANLFTELTNHKTLVLYGIDTEVTEGYNHTARKSDGVHKTFVISLHAASQYKLSDEVQENFRT